MKTYRVFDREKGLPRFKGRIEVNIEPEVGQFIALRGKVGEVKEVNNHGTQTLMVEWGEPRIKI